MVPWGHRHFVCFSLQISCALCHVDNDVCCQLVFSLRARVVTLRSWDPNYTFGGSYFESSVNKSAVLFILLH